MNRTSCIVSFGSNALAIGADASIAELNGDLQPFADLDALEVGTVASKPYATYEPNYWLLDGNFKFVPDANAKGGWVSEVMSGSTGGFDVASPYAELQIDFDDVHSTDGLYLTFSNTGDYADTVRIVFYNAALATILDTTYNPTSETFFTNQVIANFKRILISIRSTNRAQRYARLFAIDFDTLTRFEGSDIKAARVVEEINPLSLELPINTLELDLFSTDGDFSIVEPAGFYATLQYKEPLDVHEDINGSIIYIGRFYLDAWESKSENEIHFEASDAIGILDTVTYLGGFWPPGILAVDIIDEIFSTIDIPYEIDSFWTSYGISGSIPVGSAREALQQIAFALSSAASLAAGVGAIVTCDRTGTIYIKTLAPASTITDFDFTLTAAEKGISSPLTLRPLVTGIEITAYEVTGATSPLTELFDGILAAGLNTIVFDFSIFNPSVTAGATIVTNGGTYLILNVSVGGTYVVSGYRYEDIKIVHRVNDLTLAAGVRENIIRIEDATLIGNNLATNKATFVLNYYKQRYLQKTKLFGSLMAPGDSVLVDVQSSRQLAGIVERMETDLAGGYVSNVDIVGVVI